MSREEWGRRVLAAALRRLRLCLRSHLLVQRCRVRQHGEIWSLELTCVLRRPAEGVPTANVPVNSRWIGHGTARLQRQWLPGDPRLHRCLQMILAQAAAEVVENSGLGLRALYGFGRSNESQVNLPGR